MPSAVSNAKRLLMVAWAGADWRIAEPLRAAGEMLALDGLVAAGAGGNLTSLNPQSAALQWTSLLTGKRADRHAMLGQWGTDGEGVWPLSSRDRQAMALWNLLAERGLKVHALGWPFSYPAEAITGCLVSELFGEVAGRVDAPDPLPPGAVTPVSSADDLEPLRIHPGELGLDELGYFVVRPEEVHPDRDGHLRHVATAVARSATLHAVATQLLEERDWGALLVHYDLLDILGPRFMALQPPCLPYVPTEQVDRYGGVVQAAYRYLDMQLARLLDLAGDGTTLVLVSQRGYRTGGMRPQTPEVAAQRLAAPWYRDQGMLVLAGPGVRKGVRIEGAGLLDIVPTCLALLGLPPGRDMDGRVLRQVLASPIPPSSIASWEPPAAERPAQPALNRAEREAILGSVGRRVGLGESGELDEMGNPVIPTPVQARTACDFNLAMVHLEAGRPDQAEPLLAGLASAAPEDARLKIHLARAREALGDREAAVDLYAQVVAEVPQRPHEQLALADLQSARADDRKALMHLFRAEQAEPNQPLIHCRIGGVYLRLRRWDEAMRAFGKALELDPDDAVAHHGVAVVHLAQGRNAEAMEAGLTAVGLRHHAPQAHFHLGVALARLGQGEAARTAFETALEQSPRLTAAHRWLARLYADQPDKAGWHAARIAELEAAEVMQAWRKRPQ